MLATEAAAVSQPRASSPVPPDSEIRKILSDRIDKYGQSVGIVVGIIEPQGQRVVAYGHLNQGDPRPLNGDTVFEIDSITKVFTGLLLTDMVARKEVTLTDPVAKYLPSDVKVPERGGRQIRLLDLATHHSGLPDLPLNAPLYEQDQLATMEPTNCIRCSVLIALTASRERNTSIRASDWGCSDTLSPAEPGWIFNSCWNRASLVHWACPIRELLPLRK
jgi:CubicO group peptidase (beta-lactamase class C family)